MTAPNASSVQNTEHLTRPNAQPWSDTEHPQVLIRHGDWSAYVDEGIADDVLLLWQHGIATYYSCQGDEEGGRYISLETSSDVSAVVANLLPWVRSTTPSAVYGDPMPSTHDAEFLAEQAGKHEQLRRAGFPLLTSAAQDYQRTWDRLRLEAEVDRYLGQVAS